MVAFNPLNTSKVWFSTTDVKTNSKPLEVVHDRENTAKVIVPYGKKGVEIELFTFDEKASNVSGKYTNLQTHVSDKIEFTQGKTVDGVVVFIGKAEGPFERVRWYLFFPLSTIG